jgi:simple sugar transport system ATP-binding protein
VNALELRHVSRRFGEVQALRDVSMCVRPGTVHALLGENGAGKTTLMRVAFGLIEPDQGEVLVNGEVMRTHSPTQAIAHHVGMVHQHFTLVAAMSVAENVALGSRGRYVRRDVAQQIRAIGERTGLSLDPEARVGALSVSAQQRCEIVKALARDATVLRRGACVSTGPASDHSEASLADAMLGPGARTRALEDEVVPAVRRHTDSVGAHHVVLQADAVTVHDARGVPRVGTASFTVRAGEIVGIAAVEGSGQAELLRAVAGLLPISSGRLHVPDDVGFVPEDRHRDALLLDASLTENLALRDAGRRRGRMPWSALTRRTSELLQERDVRAAGPRVIARTLSGGNQQKFILARTLDDAPAALVVENPTRGLDFRATAAVHDALRDARDAGIAILFYSSDLDEVLTLGDRVLAMHNGMVREVPRERDVVGRAMLAAS